MPELRSLQFMKIQNSPNTDLGKILLKTFLQNIHDISLFFLQHTIQIVVGFRGSQTLYNIITPKQVSDYLIVLRNHSKIGLTLSYCTKEVVLPSIACIYHFVFLLIQIFPCYQSHRNVPHSQVPTILLLLLLSCFNHVRLCATPQTAAHQAPPSLGFSRQESYPKSSITH